MKRKSKELSKKYVSKEYYFDTITKDVVEEHNGAIVKELSKYTIESNFNDIFATPTLIPIKIKSIEYMRFKGYKIVADVILGGKYTCEVTGSNENSFIAKNPSLGDVYLPFYIFKNLEIGEEVVMKFMKLAYCTILNRA